MSLQQELSSWFAPKPPANDDKNAINNEKDEDDIPPVPKIGDNPPSVPKLSFQPEPNRNDGGPPRPTILAFLRHCGCPFAEKTFLNLRETARNHRGPTDRQDAAIDFIAISHSSATATETWLQSLPQAGSEPGNLRVIVDEDLEIYRAWGLGVAGYSHVLSPRALGEVWRLGSEEGIWNRPTESGSRWQVSGFFAVGGDEEGEGKENGGNGGMVVKWGRGAERADDVPDFEEAVRALGR
ncbi:hypothetical protein KC316_g11047 [Hortaea werneckii]|uniref:Alkyl hydroperoxide reductase subunit C/ Thiol specific antioxidant domain-containing protein n=4 Tax=Hortaea werneckii TaxID=91943 RepID=A0A3M6ZS21_HORWE|nr:hypothetical protein KC334_g2945 [Hortaea werneckii]KAI7022798.1 hypothetical protein KC355_g1945 [Hortaea werneckii]KAI7187564.1 hypothetical protein KC324_g6878 [Hortaea werneckii]KAI7575525.1 hypothetical protein KC316_g11047 [Hortaea werneckii]RMY17909.1 hypothetical protein D0866_13331 [Hortaea werneckii]